MRYSSVHARVMPGQDRVPRPKEIINLSRGTPSAVLASLSQRSGTKDRELGKMDSSWCTSGMVMEMLVRAGLEKISDVRRGPFSGNSHEPLVVLDGLVVRARVSGANAVA